MCRRVDSGSRSMRRRRSSRSSASCSSCIAPRQAASIADARSSIERPRHVSAARSLGKRSMELIVVGLVWTGNNEPFPDPAEVVSVYGFVQPLG